MMEHRVTGMRRRFFLKIMEATIYKWLTFTLPVITSAVSWFLGRHQRAAGTLQQMQESIDMLVLKNSELYKRMVEQNAKLVELKRENYTLKQRIEHNNETIAALKTEVEKLNRQLNR